MVAVVPRSASCGRFAFDGSGDVVQEHPGVCGPKQLSCAASQRCLRSEASEVNALLRLRRQVTIERTSELRQAPSAVDMSSLGAYLTAPCQRKLMASGHDGAAPGLARATARHEPGARAAMRSAAKSVLTLPAAGRIDCRQQRWADEVRRRGHVPRNDTAPTGDRQLYKAELLKTCNAALHHRPVIGWHFEAVIATEHADLALQNAAGGVRLAALK